MSKSSEIYDLVINGQKLGRLNTDELTITLNWDYVGRLPKDLFPLGSMDENITQDMVIAYILKKTYTKFLSLGLKRLTTGYYSKYDNVEILSR